MHKFGIAHGDIHSKNIAIGLNSSRIYIFGNPKSKLSIKLIAINIFTNRKIVAFILNK